jgi:hypothetical protein
MTTGSVRVRSGSGNGTARFVNGTYTEVLVQGTSGWVQFTPSSDFDGAIDNVSVKEVITAGNAYKRLSYADCLAIVPFEGGVVPQWAKPDGPCLLNDLVTWPNNIVWTAGEWAQTNRWRTQLTEECGAEALNPLRDVNGDFILDVTGRYILTQP